MGVARFDRFGDPLRAFDRTTSQMVSVTRTPMGMPIDVWSNDEGGEVAMRLRGEDPGSVEITSERNVLTIRAERRAEYEEGHNVLLAERPQGSFTRQMQVSDALDTEKVQATYDNGVLMLTIPLSQAAQPRRIEIQHGAGPQQLSVGGAQQS